MRYSLNAPAGAQLPPVLAERYKTADGAALKVALLFLEQPQADCETVCRVLNMTEAVAQRALNYWVSAGLLVTGEGKPAGAGRYTVEMFARSSLNDPELSVLLREAQRLLGRPTAHRENLMLAALYDAEGLPVEFILFVLEYSRRLAEAGSEVNYADRVARRWQKAGIVTLPQAEDYVRGLERQERQQRARRHRRHPESPRRAGRSRRSRSCRGRSRPPAAGSSAGCRPLRTPRRWSAYPLQQRTECPPS